MNEPLFMAMSLNGQSGNGALLLLNLFQRAKAGIFGPNQLPRCLTDAVWIDAGYALDAPELMPAGGCAHLSFPSDDDLPPVAEQLYVYREPV